MPIVNGSGAWLISTPVIPSASRKRKLYCVLSDPPEDPSNADAQSVVPPLASTVNAVPSVTGINELWV